MTYQEIATALSVEGKTVSCDAAIKGRAAVVRLTDRTWEGATSILSKGLGLKFEQDKRIETLYRMIPDPVEVAVENRLYTTYVTECDKNIQDALTFMRTAAGAELPANTVEGDALMERYAPKAEPGDDQRAWVRVLQSDFPDSKKAALFQLRDFGQAQRATPEPLLAYFQGGGKLATLISGGLTFRSSATDLGASGALNGSLGRHVRDVVAEAEERVANYPEIQDAGDWRRAKDVTEFRQALGQTSYVADFSFEPRSELIALRYKSFNPSLVNLVLGGSTYAFSDLTSLNTFRLKQVYEKAGQEKLWDSMLRSTKEFLATEDAGKPFEFRPSAGSTSALLADWAEAREKDVVIEYDIVEDSGLYGRPGSLGKDGKGMVNLGQVTWFKARTVDRKAYPVRGLPSPGDWCADETDGALIVKSVKRFLNRKYDVSQTNIVPFRNKTALKPIPTIPLSAALEFGKNAKAVEAGALARFSRGFGAFEPGIAFPFLKWMTGLSPAKLNQLKAGMKADKTFSFPVGAGQSSSLAEDIRTVSLQLSRRDIDYIFVSMSSHPGFDSFILSSEIRVTLAENGSTSFGLGAPGEHTNKGWFGPLMIDWDN